jgi:HTH-type transcriptional regulator/antitoxin HipB
MDYPIRFADQLKQHLRSLRKTRGMTQAQLGQKLGVKQARIAEIEAGPGVVSIDQMTKLLAALNASLVLRDGGADIVANDSSSVAKPVQAAKKKPRRAPLAAKLPPRQWETRYMYASPGGQPTPVLVTPVNSVNYKAGMIGHVPGLPGSGITGVDVLNTLKPDKDVSPTSRRNLIIRPKKGSW